MSSGLTNKDELPGRVRYELEMLESTAINFGYRLINDSVVRRQYITAIKKSSDEIINLYKNGTYTAEEAAIIASKQRNILLSLDRKRSSDIGRAYAEYKKQSGLSMGELEERYASRLFPQSIHNLNKHQKNKIYYEILKKSGTGNAAITFQAKMFNYAGKTLVLLSAAIITYNVIMARDKKKALIYNGAILGTSAASSAAAGASAGVMCGPAAPVCVSIGAFIGGVLGAAGAISFLKNTSISHYE